MVKQSQEKILVGLRHIESEVESHVASGQQLATSLHQALAKAPPQALFLYATTRHQLLNAAASLRNTEDFLSGTKAGDRITVGPRLLSRSGYAAHILKKHRDQENKEPEEPLLESEIEQALQVVKNKQSGCAKQLALLEDSRKHLLHDFREILRHIQSSRELVLSGNESAGHLEAVVRYVCNEERLVGGSITTKQHDIDTKATALLRGKNARLTIRNLTQAYLSELSANRNRVTKARKRKALKQAACQRARAFDEQCGVEKRGRFSTICLAIVALCFAYACEQFCDVGKMATETRRKHEKVIAQASKECLEQTVREILEQGILVESDFAFLRYHEEIRQALFEVIG